MMHLRHFGLHSLSCPPAAISLRVGTVMSEARNSAYWWMENIKITFVMDKAF